MGLSTLAERSPVAFAVAVVLAVVAVLALSVERSKGRLQAVHSLIGVVIAVAVPFFGPLGVLLALVMTRSRRERQDDLPGDSLSDPAGPTGPTDPSSPSDLGGGPEPQEKP